MINWIHRANAMDPTGRVNNSTGRKKEYGTQHTIPNIQIFRPLFNKINKIGSLELNRFFISDIWTNYNPPNGVNNKHRHIDADISGCYYLYVPENSGEIEFETGEKFLPLANEIYWWDSRLEHWVHTNNSNEIRISIAFNIKQA